MGSSLTHKDYNKYKEIKYSKKQQNKENTITSKNLY